MPWVRILPRALQAVITQVGQRSRLVSDTSSVRIRLTALFFLSKSEFTDMRYILSLLIAVLLVGCGSEKSTRSYKSTYSKGQTDVWVRSDIHETLGHMYNATSKEIPLCLHGTKSDSSIFVNRVSVPHITSSTDSTAKIGLTNEPKGNGVYNETCVRRGNFLGLVHNHNVRSVGQCPPSPSDWARFRASDRAHLEMIACRGPWGIFLYSIAKQDLVE
jgi:hypothetical protein